MRSMTGSAAADARWPGGGWWWRIRSVNHRFVDLKPAVAVRHPVRRAAAGAGDPQAAGARCSHGDGCARTAAVGDARRRHRRSPLARAYATALTGSRSPVVSTSGRSLTLIAAQPGVLCREKPRATARRCGASLAGRRARSHGLMESRGREGEALRADLAAAHASCATSPSRSQARGGRTRPISGAARRAHQASPRRRRGRGQLRPAAARPGGGAARRSLPTSPRADRSLPIPPANELGALASRKSRAHRPPLDSYPGAAPRGEHLGSSRQRAEIAAASSRPRPKSSVCGSRSRTSIARAKQRYCAIRPARRDSFRA